jgi:Glucodextranase, domain B
MVAGVLAAGCGAQTPVGPPTVDLSLVAPTDGATVNVRSVTVLGHVDPASAHVKVAGRPVAVQKGLFHFRLVLSPRVNRIGISATAPGYRAATMETTVRYARRRGPAPGQDYADRAERICTAAGDQIGTLPKITDRNVATVGHQAMAIDTNLVRRLTNLTVPRSVAEAYHKLVVKLQTALPIAERGLNDRINGDIAGLEQALVDLNAVESEPALYNQASRLDIPDCGGILDTGLHGR